jgi:hypothetical protein
LGILIEVCKRFVEGFKAFLSFGVELGLDKKSWDGLFEDCLALGIKLVGIHSTLGVKLGIADSPEVGFGDGSSLVSELGLKTASKMAHRLMLS